MHGGQSQVWTPRVSSLVCGQIANMGPGCGWGNLSPFGEKEAKKLECLTVTLWVGARVTLYRGSGETFTIGRR